MAIVVFSREVVDGISCWGIVDGVSGQVVVDTFFPRGVDDTFWNVDVGGVISPGGVPDPIVSEVGSTASG